MGNLRYFRRVRVAPGVTLNLARRGPSVSFGVRGAHLTVGRSGVRKTAGLPGSGAYYTSHQGWHSGVHTAPHFAAATTAPAAPPRTGWAAAGHIVLRVLEMAAIAVVAILGVALIAAGGGAGRRR